MDKVFVFNVWGDYAHFRKIYTTTSPLTYSFPPRTALVGLISAIIGIDKNEYIYHFSKEKAFLALKIISPIKKVRIGENLIDTKSGHSIKMHIIKNRTQIRYELVKNPSYRIYFWHKDNKIYDTLKEFVQQHKCVYTPYFGLSELLCNFEYFGEYNIKGPIRIDEEVELSSCIPVNIIKKPNFEIEKEYFTETIPIEMKENRIVMEYQEVLYERQGKNILMVVDNYWELENNEKIVFL
ncbi:MAG TPA: type I-B CRISPR-associated protein Cas5b [Exilispira sp.]|nr:type I-B CRISPR-associated protein Cas5b [Exilispira sp.]